MLMQKKVEDRDGIWPTLARGETETTTKRQVYQDCLYSSFPLIGAEAPDSNQTSSHYRHTAIKDQPAK
jgi:hypothetical protein